MKYILHKEDINNLHGLAKTHFLNGNAKRVNRSLGDAVGLKNLGFHIIEVEPGFESTEYHVHHYEDECVYILDGAATVTIDDKDYDVCSGDFIGYPAGGLPHTMKNTGTKTLRCIVVGQRLAHDVGDYPNKNKRIYRNSISTDVVNLDQLEHPTVGTKK